MTENWNPILHQHTHTQTVTIRSIQHENNCTTPVISIFVMFSKCIAISGLFRLYIKWCLHTHLQVQREILAAFWSWLPKMSRQTWWKWQSHKDKTAQRKQIYLHAYTHIETFLITDMHLWQQKGHELTCKYTHRNATKKNMHTHTSKTILWTWNHGHIHTKSRWTGWRKGMRVPPACSVGVCLCVCMNPKPTLSCLPQPALSKQQGGTGLCENTEETGNTGIHTETYTRMRSC